MAEAASVSAPDVQAQPWRGSAGRKWFFRLIAAVLVPGLVLGLAEAALRAGGYGYATSFFVPLRIGGTDCLVANPAFGARFFPPALARSPSPVVMQANKPPGVYRIFLFGESAALGDPRPAYGVGRYLQVLLRERYPGAEFEVIPTAMTAVNSHAVLPIARECAQYEGDLWLIYTGNNEFAGPFGANTVFGGRSLPTAAIRAYLLLQRTRTGQGLVALARHLTGSRAPAAWDGLKMFQEHQLPPDDPRKARVYASFRRNLEDILRTAQRAGVPVLLSSVVSNLKDCAPFGSHHAKHSAAFEMQSWEGLFQAGITNAEQQRWPEAMASFQQAARQNPNHAEGHYRLAEAFVGAQQRDLARGAFTLARDLDTLPFRADSSINAIIEATARGCANQSVSFLDAHQALAAFSPDGIPGQESLYEHVHLNFDGNYRLARAFAEQVALRLPSAVSRRQTPDWADPALCAERLGLTDWNRYTAFEEIIERVSDAPFTNQANHSRHLTQLNTGHAELKQRLQPHARAAARQTYESALEANPGDHWLHYNYAEFLAAVGLLPEAEIQLVKVRELLPHHHAADLQLGRLYARQKKFSEAERSIQHALRLRPGLAEAHLELGQVYANQGKLEDALCQYALVQKLRPADASVYLLRARVFDQQNRRDAAIGSLRQAVNLRPFWWEARHLLGVQLLLNRQFAQAESELREVVRLRPDHAPGHLNLGFALAQQQLFGEATMHFRETLRLEPDNAQARQFLQTAEQIDQAQSTR